MIEMTLLEKETTERDLRDQLIRVTAEKVEAEAQRRKLEHEAEGHRREAEWARDEVERGRQDVERVRRELKEVKERKAEDRERYETFRQKLVKEATEVSQRKREEVVMVDTTRRETKREDVKKVELKRVGSLVMKEERQKEEYEAEDYNTHLLKSIQKMAASKATGKTSRSNLKEVVKSSQNRSRKSNNENPFDQIDLQNILKATMNGEDSCGDLHSQFGGILEASQSSLNIKDLLPHFNEQAKMLANALNI